MRLDFLCPVTVEDTKGDDVAASRLRMFDGVVFKDDDANFATHLEDSLHDAELQGERLTLQFDTKTGRLFARASFHEGRTLSEAEIEELRDHVEGQFSDGYGEEPAEIRVRMRRYVVTFADGGVIGPIRVDAKRPKVRRKPERDGQARKLSTAAMNGDMAAVTALLDKGVDIDAVPRTRDPHDTAHSALTWAANRDHHDVMEMLLARGADPNVRGSRGNTALMLANSVEAVEMLLQAGADPQLVDESGQTAVEYLIGQRGHVEDEMETAQGEYLEYVRNRIAAYTAKIEAIKEYLASR